MSANSTLHTRTPVQRQAVDVAMRIFREQNLVPWFQLQGINVRNGVTAALAAYPDQSVVERIARSNPGLPVKLEGDYLHAETWFRLIATEVVIRLIHDIVGINPIHGERDERGWVFLGREIRNQADLSRTPLYRAVLVDESELVDLWASVDGQVVMVVDGRDVRFANVEDGESSPNNHIREAIRRRRLLRLPVPA